MRFSGTTSSRVADASENNTALAEAQLDLGSVAAAYSTQSPRYLGPIPAAVVDQLQLNLENVAPDRVRQLLLLIYHAVLEHRQDLGC